MEPAIVSVTNDSDTSSGHETGIQRLGEPEEGLVALSAFFFIQSVDSWWTRKGGGVRVLLTPTVGYSAASVFVQYT